MYLTAAVAALGLAVYLSSFGPLFTTASADFFSASTLLDLGVVVGRCSPALMAGVGLLPKQKAAPALVAVLSVLGFLLVIADRDHRARAASKSTGALYLIIAFSVLQAIVAVAALLFDAGVITPPAPKPRYEQQQQYGQYGGARAVLRTAAAARPAARQHGPQQQQRPGYPPQYGGGYPGGAVDRRLLRRGPQQRPADAAHRLPHLRPAAVEQCGQIGQRGQQCNATSPSSAPHAVRARRRRRLAAQCVQSARRSLASGAAPTSARIPTRWVGGPPAGGGTTRPVGTRQARSC